MSLPVVVGLGSDFADDCAGWMIVEGLQARGYPQTHLRRLAHPVHLLDALGVSEHVVICDACEGAGAPGSVHHWIWPTPHMHQLSCHGTHQIGLNDVLTIGQFVDKPPIRIDIWAVEGASWSPGTPLDVNVQRGIEAITAFLWQSSMARVPTDQA